MNSCPKCGSIRVEISSKRGKCNNCNHEAPRSYFSGLNGKRDNRTTEEVEHLGGGSIRHKAIFYDED